MVLHLSTAKIVEILDLLSNFSGDFFLTQRTLRNANLYTLELLNQCYFCMDTHNLSNGFLEGQILLAKKHIDSFAYGDELYKDKPYKLDRAVAMNTLCRKILEERAAREEFADQKTR